MKIQPLVETESQVVRRLSNFGVLPVWLQFEMSSGKKAVLIVRDYDQIPVVVDEVYSLARPGPEVVVLTKNPYRG